MRGGSWGPDDTIVFATTASKGLRRVPAAGGEAQVLTKVDLAKGETNHWWPEILPDGKGVLFTAWDGTAERSRIVALSLLSGPSGASNSEREDAKKKGNPPHEIQLDLIEDLYNKVKGHLNSIWWQPEKALITGKIINRP